MHCAVCILQAVQCVLYKVCRVYCSRCAVCIVQDVQCVLYKVCIVYYTNCTVCIVQGDQLNLALTKRALTSNHLGFRKTQPKRCLTSVFAICFAPRTCRVLKFGHMIDVAYFYHVSQIQHPTRSRSETYGKKLSSESINQCLSLDWPKLKWNII